MKQDQTVKFAENLWNKEIEYKQTMDNVTRMEAIEKEKADARYNCRKILDKSYTKQAETKKRSKVAQKVPNITGPVSIAALGSSYAIQLQKQQQNDLKQAAHNNSVEKLIQQRSVTEITQENFSLSPLRDTPMTNFDLRAERKRMNMLTK